jgi:hypothetical protein
MFVVDTNIVVYGADRDSPDHRRCRALIEQRAAGSREGSGITCCDVTPMPCGGGSVEVGSHQRHVGDVTGRGEGGGLGGAASEWARSRRHG